MKLADVLNRTKDHFQKLGFDSPKLDAEVLLSEALNWKRLDLYLKTDYPLNATELEKCRDYVRRRQKGEPVAYILGKKAFYNIELFVDNRVLIPRSETEHIVDEVLSYVKANGLNDIKILDLGAGSGCVGFALLKELPTAKLVSVEKSAKAFEVLKLNAEKNHLLDRAQLFCCAVEDIDTLLLQNCSFDIIVSNPPYIDTEDTELCQFVKSFEPNEALFAGEKGFEYYNTWVKLVKKFAKPSAFWAFEMGHKQASGIQKIWETLGLQNIKIVKDYSKKDRVITANS